ncbi:ABC transporter permease [Rhodococcus sp. TAF43]|uniref:ABC transporter permease n=1 Tax=unclassified Rhodococcus (in: high G+C Gram-positive bacteria) TaxID=192944 RepID=UPI0015839D49|nr:ABC transporter permease [Rhodococcus sp. W8901]QKT12785.1 ABC transporter permease [Rhodococcus sp. W8901]
MTTSAKSAANSLSVSAASKQAALSVPAKRIGSHRRPDPNAFQQWMVLTGRTLKTMVKTGELAVAIVAPLIFTIGFYLPLRFVMKLQGIDYAQFLMPIIVLQAMAFTAISASQLASVEALHGLTTRLKTMPVSGPVPLLSRMTSALVRSTIALAAALAYGYAIGFRFSAGFAPAGLFCVMALAISLALSLGADAIGTLSKSPEATAQALALPQLILGMLSCGFVPESGFPEWIRPFVRNQPISQFSYAMRDMAEGGLSASTLFPATAWCVGLAAVFAPLAWWASMRRQ